MARLRKPGGDTAPITNSPPTTAQRETRRSPRKTVRESPSKRALRYTSPIEIDDEDSFLVPKLPASRGDTPRKQRVLRPVASNSRLLRQPSDESFATPEKKERLGGRENGLGFLYSRGLARSVARKRREREDADDGAKLRPIDMSLLRLMDRSNAKAADQSFFGESIMKSVESDVQVQELKVEDDEKDEEVEEVDETVEEGKEDDEIEEVCESAEEEEEVQYGEAEKDYGEKDEREYKEGDNEEEYEDEDEDEDDEPVIDARYRKRQAHASARPIIREEETEDEDAEEGEEPDDYAQHYGGKMDVENGGEIVRVASQRKESQVHRLEPEKTEGMPPPIISTRPRFRKGPSVISNWAQEVIDLTSSPEPPASFVIGSTQPAIPSAASRPTTSSSNDGDAVLQYLPTPTKQRSPRKAPPSLRPSTPPLPPPSPSKLVSPSKKKHRIPDVPDLWPSIDAFWCPEVVNSWNEKHSPTKPLLSPRKQKLLKKLEGMDDSSDSDVSYVSKPKSPRKKTTEDSCPTKKVSVEPSPSAAELRAQQKAFSETKHHLAESFLREIDNTITGGRISFLCQNTGGIKLVWSKSLKTTAGRANWRREQLRLRTGPSNTDIRVEYRHHCSIELAEKVIDDDERLYNVLAHEYCHLTTFMISEVRNNPHGAEFKSWAAKVSKAFAHKGVEVTTKHSYQIAYKYIWECVVCGYEFKRHSKSVDPARHSCGRCKGKLVQTKPTPRVAAKGADGKPKEKSEYQVFVKANYSKVKEKLAAEGKEVSLGKVMAVVAEEYKIWKEKRDKKAVVEVEELFEGLKIQEGDA